MKNIKKGEVSGLTITIKVLLSCIIAGLILTVVYGFIQDYYVKGVTDNQAKIYSGTSANYDIDTTMSTEVEHRTYPEF